jgi:hypothetical protein
MEVNNSSKRIEKLNERPGTISLKEFKTTFSTMVYEMELKYGANYTEVFAFKQLTHYVHYGALDVYKQHFLRISGVMQIPNLAYATTITTASQATLQATITHNGTLRNNPDLIPTSINFFPQQLIIVIINIPPTINALAFADIVGEFFRVFELEFLVKSFEKNLQLVTFSRQKAKTLKMLYKRLFKLKKDIQNITDLKTAHRYFRSLEGILTFHA